MFGGQTSTQAGGERSGRKIRLDVDDVDAIRDAVPMVAAISPEVLLYGTPVTHEYRTKNMTIRAVLPSDYQKVRNMTMDRADGFQTKTSCEKSASPCSARKRPRNCLEKRRPKAKRSPSTVCSSKSSGVLKTKVQISNYNTPDNECVFIPTEPRRCSRIPSIPKIIVWSPANPQFRAGSREAGARNARAHS